MKIQRSILATLVALALAAGAAGCDPGSDEPQYEPTTGYEEAEGKPGDDDEGLVDDQTFGDEGIVDDEEGVVPDDTFGDEGIIDDNP